MNTQAPGGGYYLCEGVSLIPQEQGGLVLQSAPLKTVQVNTMALEILGKCRAGFSPPGGRNARELNAVLDFLDLMQDAGIVYWLPPEEVFEPVVSIIVPVYNRAHDIGQCLDSLLSLDYPESRREIIVVDDASLDQTAAVVARYDVRLIVQPSNRGQSAARNAGVQAARGEVFAFIDSDCIADPRWLKDLMPYLHDPRLALVGGVVDAFFNQSFLDRYEAVHSALNMGSKTATGRGKGSLFYVPTCNMLLRKAAFEGVSGLDENLKVGEDVDLCWRLMSMGYRLAYIPKGRVQHKHRNRFFTAFLRLFDYGTSEAVLSKKHPHVLKRFPWHWEGILLLLLMVPGLTMWSIVSLIPGLSFLLVEPFYKQMRLKRSFDIVLPLCDIFAATVKRHLILVYYISHHITRYYLFLVIIFSILIPRVAPLLMGLVILPAIVEFFQKKPLLRFPVFAFFYWTEQLFYQSGVFWGCLNQFSFRPYRVSLKQTPPRNQNPHPMRQRVMALFLKSREASR